MNKIHIKYVSFKQTLENVQLLREKGISSDMILVEMTKKEWEAFKFLILH
ncbi:hypothetical protein PM10SUCC1_00280 [Propionigenium maris DSM 9537]|uniref:Uncharacterized protein n=1 Tax=Propionigenium maris DSM 9537 TaxID=1123000 RepID=A0A9W6LLM1_9FUSO|nr:hypothetical protein [Propionigenium maris]GLI54513.1 hypothetical protein PM10SUCC1_00280 [Propionigenium maris DSM 9537]